MPPQVLPSQLRSVPPASFSCSQRLGAQWGREGSWGAWWEGPLHPLELQEPPAEPRDPVSASGAWEGPQAGRLGGDRCV